MARAPHMFPIPKCECGAPLGFGGCAECRKVAARAKEYTDLAAQVTDPSTGRVSLDALEALVDSAER